MELVHEGNDMVKPCVASLHLDPPQKQPLYFEDDFSPHIKYCDENGCQINSSDFHTSINENTTCDNCIGGELLENIEPKNSTDDAIVNKIQHHRVQDR